MSDNVTKWRNEVEEEIASKISAIIGRLSEVYEAWRIMVKVSGGRMQLLCVYVPLPRNPTDEIIYQRLFKSQFVEGRNTRRLLEIAISIAFFKRIIFCG